MDRLVWSAGTRPSARTSREDVWRREHNGRRTVGQTSRRVKDKAVGLVLCAASPIQLDAVIARFSLADAVLALGLLLATLYFASLAWPAAKARASLCWAGALFLRSRHERVVSETTSRKWSSSSRVAGADHLGRKAVSRGPFRRPRSGCFCAIRISQPVADTESLTGRDQEGSCWNGGAIMDCRAAFFHFMASCLGGDSYLA
jgi:hypothetical protein